LLTNAVRYTPPGGKIELRLERREGEAVATVRDSGVGIPPAQLPHLFEQFGEGDDALERRPEGGLKMGLTLVHRLVDLHDGSISATSPGPGKGTEFIVRLPVKAEVAGPTAPAKAMLPPPTMRRILVVEDNPDGREMLRRMLQLWGHQVEAAPDGLQGVQKGRDWVPEVALIDIGLPGMDGYGVARELRAALGERVFLAAMTGYGPPHDQQRAQEAGFDTFFVKPIAPQELRDWIARPVHVVH
jgi:CheY-like chemotaxis protein